MYSFTLEDLTLFGLIFVVLEITGLICAVHAILNSRTSQGAIAWALSMVTAPYLALPLYAFFGRRKIKGYKRSRRHIDLAVQSKVEQHRKFWHADLKTLGQREEFARTMENLSGLMFFDKSKVDLLLNGKATFDAIFHAIDQAQEYVLLEFFIVNDDSLGNQLKERLINCQRNGVQVYFLYDSIGSYRLSQSYRQELIEAGAVVRAFGSPGRFKNRFKLNFRNHRKIVVIDGCVGFAGGHNVGNEYLGLSKRFGFWRDTHIRLSGPAVSGLQEAFLENWYWVTEEILDVKWPTKMANENMNVLVLPSGPADELETCSLFFVQMLNAANNIAWITSPYFVPNEAVLEALKLAALRGVDVRVIIPKNPDKKTVWFAAFAYIQEAQTAGVKFYRYEKGFLHQKVMLVDNDLSVVGTANLDNRSFRLNFELSVLVHDLSFANCVKHMLNEDFKFCRLVSREESSEHNFFVRIAIAGSRLLSPLL